MPTISIIVPNYNTEAYLPRCLDSLMAQTYNDIEILVIDDGSTDNSFQIMQTYAQKDPRIKIFSQKNAGAAAARNIGLENATGKYIMFCDSDDWYEPNMCAVMYDLIEQEKTDAVCCHCSFEYEENLSAFEKESRVTDGYFNLKKEGIFKMNNDVILSTNVLLWNKIWRRDLIEKYHIRFPSGYEHEDDAFWYMYSFVAQSIYFTKQSLYHYFLRQNSVMSHLIHRVPRNRRDRISIAHYVCKYAQKHGLIDRYSIIKRIYYVQLKCCLPLFSASEIKAICAEINEVLENEIHSKYKLYFMPTYNELKLFRGKCVFLRIKFRACYIRIKILFYRLMTLLGFKKYVKKLEKYKIKKS